MLSGLAKNTLVRNSWFLLPLALFFVLPPITFDVTSQAVYAKGGNGGGNSAEAAKASAATIGNKHNHSKGRAKPLTWGPSLH